MGDGSDFKNQKSFLVSDAMRRGDPPAPGASGGMREPKGEEAIMTRFKIKALADRVETMTEKQAATEFIVNPNGHTMLRLKCLKAVGYYAYKAKDGKKIFVERITS